MIDSLVVIEHLYDDTVIVRAGMKLGDMGRSTTEELSGMLYYVYDRSYRPKNREVLLVWFVLSGNTTTVVALDDYADWMTKLRYEIDSTFISQTTEIDRTKMEAVVEVMRSKELPLDASASVCGLAHDMALERRAGTIGSATGLFYAFALFTMYPEFEIDRTWVCDFWGSTGLPVRDVAAPDSVASRKYLSLLRGAAGEK